MKWRNLTCFTWILALTILVLSAGCGGGGGGGAPTPATQPETWENTFGGSGEDWADDVQQTADGGYIAAGGTFSSGAGSCDMYLVKTDRHGTLGWEKTFGSPQWDEAYAVQQTADGGYIVAGDTDSFGAGSGDMYLVKTDGQGNLAWQQTFGGTQYDGAAAVRQTDDGGYILAGWTESFGAGSSDMYLVKTDGDANVLWEKTFGGTQWDGAAAVQQTNDGGHILAGWTVSSGAGSCDMYLVKTDADGNLEWQKTFGGPDWDEAEAVQQTDDGGYVVAGATASFGAGWADMYLVKTDGQGTLVWDATFGGSQPDWAAAVQQTDDGGYIVAGLTLSSGAGGDDMYLVKTDGDGNMLWERTFGGGPECDDEAYAVQRTADGGYILAGETESFGAGSDDMWLVKTDAEGNPGIPVTP